MSSAAVTVSRGGKRVSNTPRYVISVVGNPATIAAVRGSIRRALRETLRRHRVRSAVLSVAVVDRRTMSRLHKKHLGVAGATDVLSFDLADEPRGRGVDGELVLCLDVAFRQAAAHGHSLASELALYAVHGLLHLLQYDDATATKAARMHRMTDLILASVGLPRLMGKARVEK